MVQAVALIGAVFLEAMVFHVGYGVVTNTLGPNVKRALGGESAVELLGMSLLLAGFFVGFGVLIGVLFGFFGMGGSFLVTPALLVMGYPSRVAVGSGLAFLFGTSVIGALRHPDHGHVDYKLAVIMIDAMTFGIESDKRVVDALHAAGTPTSSSASRTSVYWQRLTCSRYVTPAALAPQRVSTYSSASKHWKSRRW